MKNFISVEEFLKQSEKVQRKLLEWWNDIPKNKRIYDLATIKDSGIVEIVWFYPTRTWKDLIPLFQMHQLIYFIQDKTDCKFDLSYCDGCGYDVYLWKHNEIIYSYDNLGQDLLQALWQVACKVACE